MVGAVDEAKKAPPFAILDAEAIEKLAGQPGSVWATYCAFLRRRGKGGTAWPSQATVALEAGFCLTAVKDALAALVGLGLLERAGYRERGVVEYSLPRTPAPPSDSRSTGYLAAQAPTSPPHRPPGSRSGGYQVAAQAPTNMTNEQDKEQYQHAEPYPPSLRDPFQDALDALIGFPRWLRDVDSPQAKKRKTVEIVTAYAAAGHDPATIELWARAARQAANPAAWLLTHLRGYGQEGWTPITRQGGARQFHAAILAGDWDAASAAQALEASYAAENRAKAENPAPVLDDGQATAILASIGIDLDVPIPRAAAGGNG